MTRQIVIRDHVTADRVYAEKRSFASPGVTFSLNGYQRRPRGCPSFLTQHLGKLSNCRRLEKSRKRQVLATEFFDPRKQSHGQQRMSAQLKEVVMDADARDPQYFCPNSGEQFF